jgi:tRNA(Met) C34 N-acetyltransferase TmcA
VDLLLSPYDLKRMAEYVEGTIDHHTIMDLLPTLARILFVHGFGGHVTLSQAQYCILLGVGLQYKQFEAITVY